MTAPDVSPRLWAAVYDEANRAEMTEETKALALADAKLTEYEAEHARQSAGFSFRCEKFGDFLAVFIGRDGNVEPSQPKSHAATINLKGTQAFKLEPGYAPDRLGVLTYWHSSEWLDAAGKVIGRGGGLTIPSPTWRNTCGPNYEVAPTYRQFMQVYIPGSNESYGRMMMGSDYDNRLNRRRTENYPRVAMDDKVVFDGIGTTIYAPAGLGQSVIDAIHTALRA